MTFPTMALMTCVWSAISALHQVLYWIQVLCVATAGPRSCPSSLREQLFGPCQTRALLGSALVLSESPQPDLVSYERDSCISPKFWSKLLNSL